MAEQFVIRIQADGQQTRAGSSGANNTAALGVAAAANIGSRPLTPTQRQALQNAGQSFINSELKQLAEQRIEGAAFVDLDRTELKRKGLFSSTWNVSVQGAVYADAEMEALSGQTSMMGSKELKNLKVFGTGHVNDFIAANQAKIAAGSVALGFKLANTYISYKQHRSGDSYYNDQLNNDMRRARYAIALGYSAKFGPKGVAVAAVGIAINEGINFATQNANFNYDRMMDTEYIHNVKQVAGDISYGRRRGGR